MAIPQERGSAKLLAAWKARALTEKSIQEIGAALDQSPGKVEGVLVAGGTNASGVRISLRYDGDDVPQCGNDILFWFKWHLTYGGVVHPPRILINGIPFPDFARLVLDYGNVPESVPGVGNLPSEFGGVIGG